MVSNPFLVFLADFTMLTFNNCILAASVDVVIGYLASTFCYSCRCVFLALLMHGVGEA